MQVLTKPFLVERRHAARSILIKDGTKPG